MDGWKTIFLLGPGQFSGSKMLVQGVHFLLKMGDFLASHLSLHLHPRPPKSPGSTRIVVLLALLRGNETPEVCEKNPAK